MRRLSGNNKEIERLNSNIDTTGLTQRDLETKIYKMSADNMMKMGEKDDLIMLLPEIVLALRREPNELKSRIQELTDADARREVRGALIEIFGPQLSKLP